MHTILKSAVSMILAFCLGGVGTAAPMPLEQEFVTPPDSARMWTWWFWLGDKVDKKSITADLEALKAQGMAGVTVYSLSGPGVPGKGPNYMSAEWRDLWKHTLKEAERLGLGVSTMLCSGWNAGGPWIQPEQACKKHVSSELTVTGPQHFKAKLPIPKSDKQFYRDTAIQAFPVSANQSTNPIVIAPALALKSLSNMVGGQSSTRDLNESVLQPLPAEAPGTAIDPAAVVDLTARCTPDGELEWDVPAGTWKILRTGFTLTGKTTEASSPTGIGLESDPLDRAAMEFQFANTAALLAEDAGPLTGKVFRSVQIDSWEINHPNWTAGLIPFFKKLHGYDPSPYLPVLSGQMVQSADVSDRFLYDYRKTVGDLVADNYFGRLSALAEAKGLIQQSEAGGVCYPKAMAMDCLKNLGRCAIPMGEFWQDGLWTEANQNKNGKQTSSAAHLYGKRIAAAEAFTSLKGLIHWADSPSSLKPTADRAFCEGFNHLFIFSSATRSEDGLPGTEFFAGTHFNRKITWWNESRGFNDYIARCSHLLQQGLFVGDVIFYNGDQCPNYVGPKCIDPSVGPGYDYDVCNSEIIMTRLAVKDDRIVLPDGMSYRVLVLPNYTTMPVEVLTKLKELVSAGMILIGPKPVRAPGLKDYPACDAQVKKLADELWGDCDGKTVTEHMFGKGRVVWGKTVREVLGAHGVKPDFTYTGAQAGAFLDWIHRSDDGTEIYFIANRMNRAEQAVCSFRVSGKQPEQWDPVSCQRRDLPTFESKDGCTTVPLELEPNGSTFIVFRKPLAGTDLRVVRSANSQKMEPLQELTGPWTVQFNPQWFYPTDGLSGDQAKGLMTFDKLEDWTQRPESAVKHFSGTAVYRKVFDLSDPSTIRNPQSTIYLDLGVVKDTAKVKLNGKDLGVVWCHPWRVDITSAVKPGENQLEIEVVNLWPNRLAGDRALPETQRRTQTNIPIDPRKPLLPSGLLGPVRLLAQSNN
jgi:hypothetical protein